MNALVLELTPSTSGWYFASTAVWRARFFEPRVVASRPTEDEDLTAAAPLGYGADRRLRTAAPHSRISLLA